MYQRKKKKLYKTIAVLVVLMLVTSVLIINIVKPNRQLSFVEKSIKDSFLFIGKVINAPFVAIRNVFTPEDKNGVIFNDEALKVMNDELRKEIADMKKLLELNNTFLIDGHLNAMVINRNLGYWYDTITIDKGSHSGVFPNMVVMTPDGLVGQVIKTSNFNSTVKLLASNSLPNKISVKIKINDIYAYGLLAGYNSDKQTFMVEGISSLVDIPIDVEVLTTGMGSMIPAGILIGRVKGVTTDNFDLAKIVEVSSKVNFDDLTYVTVLKKKVNE